MKLLTFFTLDEHTHLLLFLSICSPVRLRTDDIWMQAAVPALKKYPNMYIDISLTTRPQSSTHFTSSGTFPNEK